jgi:hypothetical protein
MEFNFQTPATPGRIAGFSIDQNGALAAIGGGTVPTGARSSTSRTHVRPPEKCTHMSRARAHDTRGIVHHLADSIGGDVLLARVSERVSLGETGANTRISLSRNTFCGHFE